MTHDYKRHGTTTLFAALNVATGEVIGQCLSRHRNTEFVKFLRTIDQQVPKDLQIHMILDNYSAHKHVNVKKWLAKHPRFHLHFTPTSSSWLNLVERWFRELTDKPSGVVCSIVSANSSLRSRTTCGSLTRTRDRTCGPPLLSRSSPKWPAVGLLSSK